MNAHLTAGQAAELTEAQCLLCGQPAHVVSETPEEVVVWDLCARCDGVFQLTAARVAAAMPVVVTGPAAAVLEHVAGQLELEDDGGEVSVLVLGQVLEALRSGDFTGVPTQDLADVLRYEEEGLRVAEVDLLKGELWRRS